MKNVSFTKKLQPTGDLCVIFTDEEMSALGISPGDKFSFEEKEGGILLKKFQTIDINLAEFSRETLESLITKSCEEDLSVNEVIENLLQAYINDQTS
jgi:bifunctional DNA-binding transcriptional regulator/antitoxin component of YhaV-PrlF toxin-antitoxin module